MGGGKIKAMAMPLVFMLPLLLLCIGFSMIYEKIDAPGRYEMPAGTRVVILGDSHAVCSLDPQRIGSAVNFSSDGESYIHNYYKLRYAVQNAPSLRVVILPIDLHSFSDFRSERVQVNPDWLRYIDYMELGKRNGRRPFYFVELLKLRCFGFRGKYERLFSRCVLGRGAAPVSSLDRGFLPKSGYFIRKNSMKSGRKRALRQLQGVDHFSPEMVFFFKRILDLARRHHLSVVLLRFPVTPEYLGTAEGLMSIDRYYARIRAITRDTPRIYFLNRQRAFRVPPGLFFRDAQHLNSKGAEKFSDLIRRDLTRLGLLD